MYNWEIEECKLMNENINKNIIKNIDIINER